MPAVQRGRHGNHTNITETHKTLLLLLLLLPLPLLLKHTSDMAGAPGFGEMNGRFSVFSLSCSVR